MTNTVNKITKFNTSKSSIHQNNLNRYQHQQISNNTNQNNRDGGGNLILFSSPSSSNSSAVNLADNSNYLINSYSTGSLSSSSSTSSSSYSSSSSTSSSSSSSSSYSSSSVLVWPTAMNQLLESATTERLEQNSDKFKQILYPDDTCPDLNVTKILGEYQKGRSLSPSPSTTSTTTTTNTTNSMDMVAAAAANNFTDATLNINDIKLLAINKQQQQQRIRDQSGLINRSQTLTSQQCTAATARSNNNSNISLSNSNSSRLNNIVNRVTPNDLGPGLANTLASSAGPSLFNNRSNTTTNTSIKNTPSPPLLDNKTKKETSILSQHQPNFSTTTHKSNFDLNDIYKVYLEEINNKFLKLKKLN
jgi:hypothetical protein